jgi:hypothetical protein
MFLSLSYLIVGLDVYYNGSSIYDDQPYPQSTFLIFELSLALFFSVASILLFQISIPGNLLAMTSTFLFR